MTIRENDGTERQAMVMPVSWAAVGVFVSVGSILGAMLIAWGSTQAAIAAMKSQLDEFKNDTKPALNDIVKRVSTIEGQLKK
jgi:hypothetical protein